MESACRKLDCRLSSLLQSERSSRSGNVLLPTYIGLFYIFPGKGSRGRSGPCDLQQLPAPVSSFPRSLCLPGRCRPSRRRYCCNRFCARRNCARTRRRSAGPGLPVPPRLHTGPFTVKTMEVEGR